MHKFYDANESGFDPNRVLISMPLRHIKRRADCAGLRFNFRKRGTAYP